MRMNAGSGMRSDGMGMHAAASDRGAPEWSAWLRAAMRLRLGRVDTLPGRIARSVIRDGGSSEASLKKSKMSRTSRGTSNFGRWDRSIRKNIIGHRMRRGALLGAGHARGRGVAGRGKQSLARAVFGNAGRPLALLDQPAGQHGARAFVHPLVNQGANFLAEIGGMSQTRKFVALERVARSREKEFPRRLGWGTGHFSLLESTLAR